VLGLEQFGMGDRPGSFSWVRMSEDIVCTKDLCWSVGTIYDPRELPGVSPPVQGLDRVLQFVSPNTCHPFRSL
jgi:hypothetical protein